MISILVSIVIVLSSCYIITTNEHIPREDLPYVGNGFIGLQIEAEYFFVNGVYNGILNTKNMKELSHRAAIPNPFLRRFYSDLEQKEFSNGTVIQRTLNIDDGYYSQIVSDNNGRSFRETYFAHRKERNLLTFRVTQVGGPSTPSCFVMNYTFESPDFFCLPPDHITVYHHEYSSYQCRTIKTESPSIDVVSVNFKLPKSGQVHCIDFYNTHTFYVGIDMSKSELETYLNDDDYYFVSHKDEWNTIWKSGIDIITSHTEKDTNHDSSDNLVGEVYQSSAYYLLSSIREDHPYAPSPDSICSNAFNGHVFWDSESWMLPSLLFFYQDYVWSAIEYRLNRNGYAEEKASHCGYKGAMFPWESASSGEEAASLGPSDHLSGKYEQHISGDIVFLFKLWDFVTNGRNKERIYDQVLRPVANFWASRVVESSQHDRRYEIMEVIPPDEDAGIVNNSIYTNAIAQISLQYASKTGKELDELDDFFEWSRWDEVSQNLYFVDEREAADGRSFTPEYDGYNGHDIKQADVVLLAFPLEWDGLPKGMAAQNLEYYEGRTHGPGIGRPAMTWSVYAIQYLKMASYDGDESKVTLADKYFQDSYQNYVSGPFHTWREMGYHNGPPHFITGAGGFMQSVLFGYVGFEFDYENRILVIRTPRLPPESKKIEVNHIHFEDAVINFHYDKDTFEFHCLEGQVYICLGPEKRSMVKLKSGEKITHPNLVYSKKYNKKKNREGLQVMRIGVSHKCYVPAINPLLLFVIVCSATCCYCCCLWFWVIYCHIVYNEVKNVILRKICCCCWKEDGVSGSRVVKDVHSDGNDEGSIAYDGFNSENATIQDEDYMANSSFRPDNDRREASREGYQEVEDEGEDEDFEEEEEEEEGEFEEQQYSSKYSQDDDDDERRGDDQNRRDNEFI